MLTLLFGQIHSGIVGTITGAEGDEAGCQKLCTPKNITQVTPQLSFNFLSIPDLPRLCVCNPGGGGRWGRIPDSWCDPARPSQQEVPLFVFALPALCLRARHAPWPASVLCGRPGVHCADSGLGWSRQGDRRCRVWQLPVSGIYPQPIGLLSSHIDLFRAGKCLSATSWFFWAPVGITSSCHVKKTLCLFYMFY